MTSGDGDRWARDMMMTLSAVWDHKKPHGSENSYQPLLTANCPASSLPKNANWRTVHNYFRNRNMVKLITKTNFCALFHLQYWLNILKFFCVLLSSCLQFLRCFRFYLNESHLLRALVKYAGRQVVTFFWDMWLCIAFLMDLTLRCFFKIFKIDLFHAAITVVTWTFKRICPVDFKDNCGVSHSSRFKALLPYYGKTHVVSSHRNSASVNKAYLLFSQFWEVDLLWRLK